MSSPDGDNKSTRPYPNKTRIKTQIYCRFGQQTRGLQDHIPTKQGLRHCSMNIRLPIFKDTTRPYPNKTRIKTGLWAFKRRCKLFLQDHIPTKQGLRLIQKLSSELLGIKLQDHIPTKQGLRHTRDLDLVWHEFGLQDHIPTKQGFLIPLEERGCREGIHDTAVFSGDLSV